MSYKVAVTAERAGYLAVNSNSKAGMHCRSNAYAAFVHAAQKLELAGKSRNYFFRNIRGFLTYIRERNLIVECKISGAFSG